MDSSLLERSISAKRKKSKNKRGSKTRSKKRCCPGKPVNEILLRRETERLYKLEMEREKKRNLKKATSAMKSRPSTQMSGMTSEKSPIRPFPTGSFSGYKSPMPESSRTYFSNGDYYERS